MLKGNDLILSIDGVRLAASKSCSVDRQVDTIEVCSPVDGPAKRYMPTTTGWSISTNGLYASYGGAERLRNIWRNYQNGVRTPLSVRYKTADGVEETGLCLLTSLQETGDLNSIVKFSIQLQGSGKLEPYEGTPLPMNLEFEKQSAILSDSNGNLYYDSNGEEKMYSATINRPTKVLIIANADSQVLIGSENFAEAIFDDDYQRAQGSCTVYKSRQIITLQTGVHYVLLSATQHSAMPKVNVF